MGCANDKKKSSSPAPPPNGVQNCTTANGQAPAGGYQYGNQYCAAGQIYTQVGCMPVCQNNSNMGLCNDQSKCGTSYNQCIAAMNICANGVPNGFSNTGFQNQYLYGYQHQNPYGYQYNYNYQNYNGYQGGMYYNSNPYYNPYSGYPSFYYYRW